MNKQRPNEPTESVDPFDRKMWSLHDLPDVVRSKAITLVIPSQEHIGTDTFIVQTYRQRRSQEKAEKKGANANEGDWIFLQHVIGNEARRIAIPPSVADCIARQREGLTTKARRKAGKEQAEERKRLGIVPAFLKKATGGE